MFIIGNFVAIPTVGLLRKNEEKQSVTSQARVQDGLDAIYPQLMNDTTLRGIANRGIDDLLSIKIDFGDDTFGSDYRYDWMMGFKDLGSLQLAMGDIFPDAVTDFNEYSNVVGYVTKGKSDYILVEGFARHINYTKRTIEIAATSPSTLEKFETFMNTSPIVTVAHLVSYSPVVLKVSAESISYIRKNKGFQFEGDGETFNPANSFICQRFSITAQFECEEEHVFINKRSEEIKDKLRPIYAMYEAAKAGDFSKIKIGLANDQTGDKTKRILRSFADSDAAILLGKFLPKFFETIKEGPNKGAIRKTTTSKAEEEERSEALKKLYATSPEFLEFFENQITFAERLESFDIPGTVVKGEAAPVEAAAVP